MRKGSVFFSFLLTFSFQSTRGVNKLKPELKGSRHSEVVSSEEPDDGYNAPEWPPRGDLFWAMRRKKPRASSEPRQLAKNEENDSPLPYETTGAYQSSNFSYAIATSATVPSRQLSFPLPGFTNFSRSRRVSECRCGASESFVTLIVSGRNPLTSAADLPKQVTAGSHRPWHGNSRHDLL